MGGRSRASEIEGLGILDTAFPVEDVRQILRETKRESRRKRKLPASTMVYYAIALGLMVSVGARQVLRHLLDHVREDEVAGGPLATGAAITKARQRLGVEPLKELFERFVRPQAKKWLTSAWYGTWRVVSLDGSTMRVLDTDANERRFGRPTSKRGTTAYPQMKIVGLLENGTRIMFGVTVGSSAMNFGIKQLPRVLICSGVSNPRSSQERWSGCQMGRISLVFAEVRPSV